LRGDGGILSFAVKVAGSIADHGIMLISLGETGMAWENEHGVVMVVDDEPLIAEFARMVLNREGYEVLAAYDAEAAWELFQRERSRVQAVLSDVVMPGPMDGLEFVRRVRQTAPETPIILVSGYMRPGMPVHGCTLLSKPFSAEALVAAVRGVVRGRMTSCP
jgi:DNA-binding response OmpR family regulator